MTTNKSSKKRDYQAEYQKNLEKYGREYFKRAASRTQIGKSATWSEKRWGIQGLKIPENTVTIVSDPDPIGGFRTGSRINGFAESLYNGALTPDTIVEHQGKRYRVVGLSRQRLEPVE